MKSSLWHTIRAGHSYSSRKPRYLALKREMAVYFMADREAYTDAKGGYIRAVIAKAKAESDTP
jgi:GrpB-like predicted nucleotidyltransferase (UPF0157 family)